MATLAAAVVLGATAGGVVLHESRPAPAGAGRGASSDGSPVRRDGIAPLEPGTPCPGAREVGDLDSLATTTGVWLPTDRKATDAWLCGSTPVVMFGMVEVSYESGWEGVDVRSKWAQLAAQEGGSVVTLLGRPAWVHPASDTGPRNSVNVVVDGTLIRVLAARETAIEEVLDVARSISVPDPAPTSRPRADHTT